MPVSGPDASRKRQPNSDASGAPKTAAAHTYDYFKDRWDKFDVEAALAEVDEPEKGPKLQLEEIVQTDSVQEVRFDLYPAAHQPDAHRRTKLAEVHLR
jgi:hypothetical protein